MVGRELVILMSVSWSVNLMLVWKQEMKSGTHLRRGVGAFEVCTVVNDTLLDSLSGIKAPPHQLLGVLQITLCCPPLLEIVFLKDFIVEEKSFNFHRDKKCYARIPDSAKLFKTLLIQI